jgi:transcriptional regulator with XRE-family HTH domain
MATETPTLKRLVRAWVEQNPLRRWRQLHHYSVRDVAVLLHVGAVTVHHWEYGTAIPTPDHLRAISALLGDPTLPTQWQAWLAARPPLPTQEAV